MSGDYSRVRFDPSLDLSGVLMQQGRVQLDSDWNEWVAVLERRLRAESVDTFGVELIPGITGVAVVSPQTPDAFKIEATGGTITLGRGRLYVDGLLAEIIVTAHRRMMTTARPSSIRCSPSCAVKRRCHTTSSRISPRLPACPPMAHTSPISRCGSAN
jgi:hypothetical protein